MASTAVSGHKITEGENLKGSLSCFMPQGTQKSIQSFFPVKMAVRYIP